MNRLHQLEEESIYLLREGFFRFERMALLWSMGKDSTTLVWLARKAFPGPLPIPVLHLDTGYKFKEIYEFRNRLTRRWKLDLRIIGNRSALEQGMGPHRGTEECCDLLKTRALRAGLTEHRLEAVALGIRRDEHGVRAKERFFSLRDSEGHWNYLDQPAELWEQYATSGEAGGHIRLHPLLSWTEIDVWEYVRQERLPVVPLYFAKNGCRYRSIGCEPCCQTVPSEATTVEEILAELAVTTTRERAGRVQDKEYAMQKLRSLGYM